MEWIPAHILLGMMFVIAIMIMAIIAHGATNGFGCRDQYYPGFIRIPKKGEKPCDKCGKYDRCDSCKYCDECSKRDQRSFCTEYINKGCKQYRCNTCKRANSARIPRA